MQMTYSEIMDAREEAEQSHWLQGLTWAEGVCSLIDEQIRLEIQKIVAAKPFDAKDSKLRIKALELCRASLAKDIKPRRGRLPKELSGPALTAEDRLIRKARVLCPPGWRETHRAEIAKAADSAYRDFIDGDDLTQQDINLVCFQEWTRLLQKLDETEKAGARAIKQTLSRPRAA